MTEERLIHTKKKQIPLYLTEVARLLVSANKRRTDTDLCHNCECLY